MKEILKATNFIKINDSKNIKKILSEFSNYDKIEGDYLRKYNISEYHPELDNPEGQKTYFRSFLESMNSALENYDVSERSTLAYSNLFLECVEFGVGIVTDEISNIHCLRDGSAETKQIMRESNIETDKWMEDLDKKIFQDALNSGSFIDAEEYVEQYNKQSKDKKMEEEIKLDKKIEDYGIGWESVLKQVNFKSDCISL